MKLRNTAIAISLVLFGGMLIIDPARYTEQCYNAICLWAESVVPSLFPFMVITALLNGLGFTERASAPLRGICRKLRLPSAAPPLFAMSCLSGYPAGSRCVAQYREYGLIDDDDAKRLSILCSTSGPLFLVGTVGVKAYGDARKGLTLLAVCLLSVICTTILYCLKTKPSAVRRAAYLPRKRGDLIQDSFYGAVSAVLLAGSFIVFFCTLGTAMQDSRLIYPLTVILSPVFGYDCAQALCLGCVEATGGIFAIARTQSFFSLPLTGFLITFGGMSIIFQQMCYFKKCNVKFTFFLGFKLLQGALAFILLCLVQIFLQ